MNVKPKLNLMLDAVTAAVFGIVVVSGLLLWLVPPPGGYGGGRGLAGATILGLDRHTYNELHIWFSLVMVALVAMHLVFHSKWISCQVRRLFRRSTHQTNEVCPEMQ